MKITKIEQQHKRKDRYSIFVDGEYSFALPDYELVAAGITKTQELSEEELAKLQRLAIGSKVYDKAIHYLSFRPRSIKEVRDHLAGKDIDPNEIEETIVRLTTQGFLNDGTFAKSWIESRGLLKPSSKRKLVMELRQKGVAAEIIETVLEEISPEDEVETIKQIAEKKIRTMPDRRKLVDYLLRQGFSYSQIQTALSELES